MQLTMFSVAHGLFNTLPLAVTTAPKQSIGRFDPLTKTSTHLQSTQFLHTTSTALVGFRPATEVGHFRVTVTVYTAVMTVTSACAMSVCHCVRVCGGGEGLEGRLWGGGWGGKERH